MTPNYTRDVTLFYEAMKLPLLGMPEAQLRERLVVHKRLIDEEFFCEFVPAFIRHHKKFYATDNKSSEDTYDQMAEVIDSVCDSIYVLLGASLAIESAALKGSTQAPQSPRVLGDCWHGLTWTINELCYAYGRLEEMNAGVWSTNCPNALRAAGVFVRVAEMLIDLGHSLTSSFDACWNEVQRSNMAKTGGPVVNGKQLKPPGWTPPNIRGILKGEV